MKKNKLFWIAAIILLICLPICFGAYEDVIGIYNVIRGGTGNQTLTDHGVLLGSGTDPITVTDSGANGEVLVSNDASADPDWEYIPRQNLLTNTQWIACFNSDSAKGIGAMTFDAGSTAAPTAGLTITGLTSSATGKLMTVTLSTGAWDANDATGTMTLGSCSERFHDGEEIYWTGGYATVNKPNSATGVDLLRNGEFSVDTDPPPGWIAGNSATLSTEAGGQVTNCMKILENGADNPEAKQSIIIEPGKNYYLSFYHKDIDGTTDNPQWGIYDQTGSAWIKAITTETANAAWTQVTWYFKAPINCVEARIYLRHDASNGDADAYYFDEVSCYEVTPGCTGADALAFDGWWKDTTLDVYREHSGSNTTDGSFYADKSVPSAQNDFMACPTYYNKDYWYIRQQGRTITVAGYAKSSTASDIKLFIYDGAYTYSSAHTGGGSYEWLEATDTISATATSVYFGYIHTSATPGIAYISQPIASYGSSIGSGNYVPEANRVIRGEKSVASQTFHNKTGASGFSDVAATELVLESDSLACIGKGANAVKVYMIAKDSGSAATTTFYYAGYDLSEISYEYVTSTHGLANDAQARNANWIPCNSSGNYEYQIEASGSNTFDIPNYSYIGIEW